MTLEDLDIRPIHVFLGLMVILVIIVIPAMNALVGLERQRQADKGGVEITCEGELIDTLDMYPPVANETMIKTVRFNNPTPSSFVVTINVNPFPYFLDYEYTVTEKNFILPEHSFRDIKFTSILTKEPVNRETSNLFFRLLVEES